MIKTNPCTGSRKPKHIYLHFHEFLNTAFSWMTRACFFLAVSGLLTQWARASLTMVSLWVAVSTSVWWASAYRPLAALRTDLWLCWRGWLIPKMWQGRGKTSMKVDISVALIMNCSIYAYSKFLSSIRFFICKISWHILPAKLIKIAMSFRRRKLAPIIRHCKAFRMMLWQIKSKTDKLQCPATLLTNISNFE